MTQDIILEIYKSVDNIRNIDAFYGFMWAVAGNVYKQWYKNKSCSEISKHLSISESMVKYLLFKSRQILKEGLLNRIVQPETALAAKIFFEG